MRGGMYRAEIGTGPTKTVRVFDNTAGATLIEGRFAKMAPETVAALPEGVFLRGQDSLGALLGSFGISNEFASWGRMSIDDPDLLWKAVIRYGAPVGGDDLSTPQVWFEPHSFNIHRVAVQEGDKTLVIDYRGHGYADANLPWLPKTFSVSLGGKILWQAEVTGISDKAPTDEMFSLKALEAEATR